MGVREEKIFWKKKSANWSILSPLFVSFVCFGRGWVCDCERLCGNHQSIGSEPGAT